MANSNKMTLDNCRGYSSEENLMRGLRRFNLVSEKHDDQAFFEGFPVRYIVARKADGNWTAIFLLSECLRVNNIGGYVGVYGPYKFMTI